MTDEVRERAVLALVSTTREQCKHVLADGEDRCAMGVIAEAFGVEPPQRQRYFPVSQAAKLLGLMTMDEGQAIAKANDSGASFDEIAKMLKDRVI